MSCDLYFNKKINVQEAICLMEEKINEIIEMYNRVHSDHTVLAEKVKELETLVDYLLGEGLAKEVVKLLNAWLADGTLADIINEAIFADLNNKINSLTSKVSNLDIVSVKDFGAKGDGITNDTVAIQAAIDQSQGKEIRFPKGTYVCDGITLKSNTKLVGVPGTSVIDFSKRTRYSIQDYKYLVSAMGTINPGVRLTSDGMKGHYRIQAPLQNIKVGDLIAVKSDDRWEEPASSIYLEIGELVKVSHLMTEPDKFQTVGALNDTYSVAKNAFAYKVNPVKDITIDGLTFVGKGRNIDPELDADWGLGFTYCEDVVVRNCEIKDIDTVGLEFRSSYNFVVENCVFNSQAYTSKDANGNVITPIPPVAQSIRGAVQYQIRCADSSMYGVIKDCVGYGSRHMFNTGHSISKLNGVSESSRGFLFGLCRFITVQGCKSTGTWHACFSTHNDAENIEFVDCMAIDSTYGGFNPRSKNINVKNCTAIKCNQGIILTSDIREANIENNKIIDCNAGIVLNVVNDLDSQNINIIGNKIYNPLYGMNFTCTSTVPQTGRVRVLDNIVYNNTVGAQTVRVDAPQYKIDFENNVFDKGTSTCWNIIKANEVSLINNRIKEHYRTMLITPTTNGIQLLTVIDNLTVDNTFKDFKDMAQVPNHKAFNNKSIDINNVWAITNTVISRSAFANRPTYGLEVGTIHFDTSLGKVIIWNGTNWVDAMGTSV